ncbi:PAS domain-containing protein [Cellulomonas sp. ATA003]|uniref:PAS domain-containing protein n=1 Tax=Cellulomonas sp. ATA003 TaxID=3073064 RepID=UPI00287370C8|nr:PAS domain-containing protein [Cellulomonas sp. ATA003]WNB84588.1 PAS domain-containing protein [Cellulomonas sp. ATA003]
MTRPRPTGVERTFPAHEIIVSKTDPRGVITYTNDVFLRVSAYREEEVLGRPHNVIRHPEMPRAVFALLWDTLARGQEMFAYIVNLAGDGAHYWVLAHVTPSFGTDGRVVGYHSNRRSPDRSAVDAVRPLYRDLLAEERRHGSARAAVAASSALLARTLEDRGTSYDEHVWSLVPEEMAR